MKMINANEIADLMGALRRRPTKSSGGSMSSSRRADAGRFRAGGSQERFERAYFGMPDQAEKGGECSPAGSRPSPW